jgi:hypothetical protein
VEKSQKHLTSQLYAFKSHRLLLPSKIQENKVVKTLRSHIVKSTQTSQILYYFGQHHQSLVLLRTEQCHGALLHLECGGKAKALHTITLPFASHRLFCCFLKSITNHILLESRLGKIEGFNAMLLLEHGGKVKESLISLHLTSPTRILLLLHKIHESSRGSFSQPSCGKRQHIVSKL